MTHIALLRGINVGGKKSVKMVDLVKVFESLGFSSVRTYVQSGNVVFEAGGKDGAALARAIERAVERAVGFAVPVITRTGAELVDVVKANPLVGKRGVDEGKLHVTFLSDKPGPVDQKALDTYRGPGEDVRIARKEVYLYCPNGYGTSKLSNALFERLLGTGATTRNWRTVLALVGMADQQC